MTRPLLDEPRLDKLLAGWSASTPDEEHFLFPLFACGQEAIRVRNRYVDPLNVIQVVLLERASTEESKQTSTNTNATMVEEPSELRVLARLTVNGIAAGMRTSG